MLYKKIHRQYLRQFKKGRTFKIDGEVYKVYEEPFIDYPSPIICVKCESMWCYNCRRCLIMMADNDISYIGKRIGKDKITWLED